MASPSDGEEAGKTASPEPGAGLSRYESVLQGVAGVIAPVTLLTAIAFYFGWARISAFDAYFGLNPATVGYSTRDYVLNSLDPLFLPVVIVLLCLIGLGVGHTLVKQVHESGDRPRDLRRLADGSILVGTVLLLIGAVTLLKGFPFRMPYLVGSLFPAGGVLMIAWGIGLKRRLKGQPNLPVGLRVLIGLMVALCLFWSAGLYASTVGRNQAALLAHNLTELPGVTLDGKPGLPAHKGGWRLLTAQGSTLFLIPTHWSSKRGPGVLEISASAARVTYTPASEKVRLGSLFADAGVLGFGGPLVGGVPPSAPGLSVTLLPSDQSIFPGMTAKFQVRLVNTGNVPLEDVVVHVPYVPGCDKTLRTFPSGKRIVYDCSLVKATKFLVTAAEVQGKEAPKFGSKVVHKISARARVD